MGRFCHIGYLTILTILIILLEISNVKAKTCFMLSGIKKEGKHGPFKIFHKSSITTGKVNAKLFCRVFQSWPDLLQATNDLPSSEELLIIQGAHGNEGGIAILDKGNTSGNEIVNTLQKISSKRKVAAILVSCYSGDILSNLLKIQEINNDDPSIDNLCLAVGSFMGRSGSASDSLIEYVTTLDKILKEERTTKKDDFLSIFKKAKMNGSENIEDIFSKVTTLSLISSAAWSESGIPGVLLNKESCELTTVFNNLHSIASYCPYKKLDIARELYFKNPLKEEFIQRIRGIEYGLHKIHEPSIFKQELNFLNNSAEYDLDDFNSTMVICEKIDCERKPKLEFLIKHCLKPLKKWFEQSTDNMTIQRWYFFLQRVKSQFPTWDKSCKQLNNQYSSNIYFNPYNYGGHSIQKKLKLYADSIKALMSLTKKSYSSHVDIINTLSSLNKVAPPKTCLSIEDRKKYIDYLLYGKAKYEHTLDYEGNAPLDNSIFQAFQAFLYGSLNRPMTHHLDKRRRRACRNFKLENFYTKVQN